MSSRCRVLILVLSCAMGAAFSSRAADTDVQEQWLPTESITTALMVSEDAPQLAAYQQPIHRHGSGHKGWLSGWTGSFEIGADGSDGNSQTLDVLSGFEVTKETVSADYLVDFDYIYESANGAPTNHTLMLLGRREWDRKGTDMKWFADGWYEYDQFQDFDNRIAFHAGLGKIPLHKRNCCTLKGRLGAGTSKQWNQYVDQEWRPEVLAGGEYRCKFNDRSSLYVEADYYPSVGDLNDFRVKVRAGWELLLNEKKGLGLKLFAIDRYDSTPADALPNDLDYGVSLIWKF